MKQLIYILTAIAFAFSGSIAQAKKVNNKDSQTYLCVDALNTVFDFLGDDRRYSFETPKLQLSHGNTVAMWEFYSDDATEENAIMKEINKDLGIDPVDAGIQQAIKSAQALYLQKRNGMEDNLHEAAELTAEIVKSDFAKHCGNFQMAQDAITEFQQSIATIPHQEYLTAGR